jgi:hypothetical protein
MTVIIAFSLFILFRIINLIIIGLHHGESLTGTYNVGLAFITLLIESVLLFFTKFWYPITWQVIIIGISYLISLVTYTLVHGKSKVGKNNFLHALIISSTIIIIIATKIF